MPLLRSFAGIALLILGCATSPPTPPPAAGTPAPVHVEVAAPRALDRVEEAVGIVSTMDSVDIRAETSGLVQAVHFVDGQAVRRGQLLVRLRDADAQAGLLESRARARLTQLALERAEALRQRQEISQADLDRALADDALARAAVLRAEEALRRTRIVAPFDGVVGRRDVSPGQTVEPARALTHIDALGELAVDISLPESALARVQADQAATVGVDALGIEIPGMVRYVAPRVRDDSRTVDVRVAISDPDPRLRPGMSATVRIVTTHVPDALLVPSEALVPGATGMALWVVGGDNTVKLTPVTTGERTAERVEILSGLTIGSPVVVEGLSRLRPGAPVAIQPAQGPPAAPPASAPADKAPPPPAAP